MQITEWLPSLAALTAIVIAVFGAVANRRKPVVDTATAVSTTATATKTTYETDVIKAEVKRISDEENLRRDLRVLDLERWGFDEVRKWGREVVVKWDDREDTIRELSEALGREYQECRLPGFPEMPPPRPI